MNFQCLNKLKGQILLKLHEKIKATINKNQLFPSKKKESIIKFDIDYTLYKFDTIDNTSLESTFSSKC